MSMAKMAELTVEHLEVRYGDLVGVADISLKVEAGQVVALGRALMREPKLLMLDEPSLGLAPTMVEQLYDTLNALHRQGLTLLLAEQSIPLALGIADYAYVLQTGRIALEGSAAELER